MVHKSYLKKALVWETISFCLLFMAALLWTGKIYLVTAMTVTVTLAKIPAYFAFERYWND